MVSFEPSTSNLRVLSRNISINNFDEKVDIFSLPLIDKGFEFLPMNEKNFEEGRAQNSFGENLDHLGNKFSPQTKYKLLGVSIDELLSLNILKAPDYIKIDVDGIELLILEGAKNTLKNDKIKSISIELNESKTDEYNRIIELLNESGFIIDSKARDPGAYKDDTKFKQQFNYIFKRR